MLLVLAASFGRTAARLHVHAGLAEPFEKKTAMVVVNGVAGDDLVDFGELLVVGLESVLAQWTIVEEVLDNDLGAVRGHGTRLDGRGFARVQVAVDVGGFVGARRVDRARHDGQT